MSLATQSQREAKRDDTQEEQNLRSLLGHLPHGQRSKLPSSIQTITQPTTPKNVSSANGSKLRQHHGRGNRPFVDRVRRKSWSMRLTANPCSR